MDLDRIRAAYHEAGHVLLAHLLGGEVTEASIESEVDDHEGHTAVAWRGLPEADRLERSALVALAGPIAETLWHGEDLSDEGLPAFRADQDEVAEALTRLAPAAERDDRLRTWVLEVATRLRDPRAWEFLCRIADMLDAHGTLDASLLEDLLDGI